MIKYMDWHETKCMMKLPGLSPQSQSIQSIGVYISLKVISHSSQFQYRRLAIIRVFHTGTTSRQPMMKVRSASSAYCRDARSAVYIARSPLDGSKLEAYSG